MCVVRLFVEAILRYGLPPAFQVISLFNISHETRDDLAW
jgi:hypothetical protein